MNKSRSDLLIAVVLAIWFLTGLFTFDWPHVAMSALGLWLLWRAREAEGMLVGRSRRRRSFEEEDWPWPMGDPLP